MNMLTVLQTLDIILPVFYAANLALYVRHFVREGDDSNNWRRFTVPLMLLIHAAYFVLRGSEFSYFPLGSKPEFFSWLAYSLVLVHAAVERQLKQGRTGMFFLAIALVFQTGASVFMEYSTKHALLLENPVYAIHVIFTVLGVTALSVGALYAVMYTILSRQLKKRELGLFFKKLPPLALLDRSSKIGTVAGIALLGFGLGVGYAVALELDASVSLVDPKLLATNIVWVGYVLGALWVKIKGLPSLKVAWLTIFWFLVFLVSAGANHSFLQ